MKKVILAGLISLSLTGTSLAFAEGSGGGGLITQERVAQRVKEVYEARAKAQAAEAAKVESATAAVSTAKAD